MMTADVVGELRGWVASLNPDIDGDTVTAGSRVMLTLLCDRGHKYRVAAYNSQRRGCSVCAGRRTVRGFNDLPTTAPRLVPEWAEDLNGALTPWDVTSGSSRRVWWRCRRGHVWQARIDNRALQRHGCSECQIGRQRSEAETALAAQLPGSRTGSRIPVAPRPGWSRPYADVDIADFGRRVVVEYDGAYWHGADGRWESDRAKTLALLDAGWAVVRVRESPLPTLDIDSPHYAEVQDTWTRNPARVASLAWWVRDLAERVAP